MTCIANVEVFTRMNAINHNTLTTNFSVRFQISKDVNSDQKILVSIYCSNKEQTTFGIIHIQIAKKITTHIYNLSIK